MLASEGLDDRITLIFKQLGAKEKEHNGNSVMSIVTTPDVMAQKVEIAYESLRRLGYTSCSNSQKHFWYISDKRKKLDTITIESQGETGFVQEKHEYIIFW
jgi:hypothetical protein